MKVFTKITFPQIKDALLIELKYIHFFSLANIFILNVSPYLCSQRRAIGGKIRKGAPSLIEKCGFISRTSGKKHLCSETT